MMAYWHVSVDGDDFCSPSDSDLLCLRIIARAISIPLNIVGFCASLPIVTFIQRPTTTGKQVPSDISLVPACQ